jgi:hypothetical protein
MSSAAKAGAAARLRETRAAERASAIRDRVICKILLRTFPTEMIPPRRY